MIAVPGVALLPVLVMIVPVATAAEVHAWDLQRRQAGFGNGSFIIPMGWGLPSDLGEIADT